MVRAADTASTGGHISYVGTLDHKLLIFDDDKEEVVGEIQLIGIPRSTILSADQKTLYIVNSKMAIEIVDLVARKVTGTIELSDEKNTPSILTDVRNWAYGADTLPRFSGVAVDPGGQFLYATLRVVQKDKSEYHLYPPKFAVINLDTKSVEKTFDFPKEYSKGFGFRSTFKVSADGKYLWVFDSDIVIIDLSTFAIVDRIPLSKPPFPGASAYHLTAMNDPNDDANTVTTVSVSVDPIVHKGTIGLATLNMASREVKYTPIGVALPMMGFMISPDRKFGYSVMYTGAGENRETEWWLWDIESHQVIKKEPFQSRQSINFVMSTDGSKMFLYSSGNTVEVWDAKTLTSRKFIDLNKNITTDWVILAAAKN